MRVVFLIHLIILMSFGINAQENDKDVDPEKTSGKVLSVTEARGLKVGVDFDNESPVLDAFYIRGSYLVYDCDTKHWVCTGEIEYKRCNRQRSEAILDMDKKLPCAIFDIYQKREDCHKAQVELTNSARFERFCLNPSLETYNLDF